MNKKVKQMVAGLLSISVAVPVVALARPGVVVKADEGDVAINEENFPDETFRRYIKRFDENDDMILSKSELDNATYIDLVELDCYFGEEVHLYSIKGVEYFYNLEDIILNSNEVSEIDVSQNYKLKSLRCSNNRITTIKIGSLPDLEEVVCYENIIDSNIINSIIIGDCPNLKRFSFAGENTLTSIDLSGCPNLDSLVVDGNFKSIDLSSCSKITDLNIYSDV